MWNALFFYLFALIALGGGVLVITRRNAVHSALWLVVSLLGVAGEFLLLGAEFLFAVQIILYIGGVVLLILFVIMLVNLDQAARMRQFNRQWAIAGLCALVVGAEIAYFVWRGGPQAFQLATPVSAGPGEGNVEQLADVLFSRYLLPFEIASLLLLVAVIGSVVMAKKRS